MLSHLITIKKTQNILKKFVIYFLVLCINLNYAASIANTSHNDPNLVQTPSSQSVPLTLNSSDLGLVGPLSIGMGYGSLDQFSVNAQYTRKINTSLAASILGEYGPEMYRFGATLGAKFLENGFGKISAEQFSQVLPFNFDSGNIDKTVKQNAYGARYQQVFNIPLLRNLNGGVYYANSPNISLDPVLYELNNLPAINYRNIAGGTSTGGDIGTEFHLTASTELSAQVYYDHLRYDTKFTDESDDNAQGLGGGLGLKQLLGDKFAISAIGSVREIYNTYTAGISWLPPIFKGTEVSLLGQSIVSHNDTPNNESIGLQFGYNFGAGGIGARYALSNLTTTKDVGEWTNTPAVYMEQVLAISEQYSEYLDPAKNAGTSAQTQQANISSIFPQGGPFTGNTKITITGTELKPCTETEWYCVQIALTGLPISLTNIQVAHDHNSFTATTPKLADTENPRNGDLIVANYYADYERLTLAKAFTFTNPPILNAISGSTAGGEVIFTGKNLGGLSSFVFNGQETAFYNVTSNSFNATIPASATGQVAIKVVTYNNVEQLSGSGIFTYVIPPVIIDPPGPDPDPGPDPIPNPVTPVTTTEITQHTSTRGVNSLASAAMNAATPKVLNDILPIIYIDLTANETIKVGESVQLHVGVVNKNESTVALKSSDVTWQSSDPKIASVDEFGKITGQAPGLVTVVASAHGVSRGVMINVK